MPSEPDRNREIRLARRPEAIAKREDFVLVDAAIPAPESGQVLVRNHYLSVEPYLRIRTAHGGDLNPGDLLSGTCVGQVVLSRDNAKFQQGDYVVSQNSYREYFVSDGKALEKIDTSIAPPQAYAGTLGIAGLTAWSGITQAMPLKKGQTVFVSSAAGGIGHIVCQIAKMKECFVAGSTSSDAKCAWLEQELGIDKAINYRMQDLDARLHETFPDGIDYYFDNVGGDHLAAALNNMAIGSQILICGQVQQYGHDAPLPFAGNLRNIIARRLTIKGFSVYQYLDKKAQFLAEMTRWQKDGKIKLRETIVPGIENAIGAFFDLYEGRSFGKMLVKLGPDAD